jgi:hypothetical protein
LLSKISVAMVKVTTTTSKAAPYRIPHLTSSTARTPVPTIKMSRQKILPGGMIVRDEKHAELRGRFFNCLKDYLFEQRYAPVSSPGLRIHRASTMLQKIFFAYREATWSRFYSEVSLPTRFDGITVVMDDPEKLGRKNGWFAEFPERYFVNNIDAKNKLLVMSPCHDIGVLKKLIEQLFAGKSRMRVNTKKEC